MNDDWEGFFYFIGFILLTTLAIFTGGLIVIPIALGGILFYAIAGGDEVGPDDKRQGIRSESNDED
mgnify:CR=1 FL=1